ncbi:MAG: hypothetical protein K6A67_11365 [Bacteroidales bacterium]|nr:hypothetical protein [Bacteroidales bacterium]
MRRTANQQRIFALQEQLPDMMPLVDSHRYDFVNYDLLDCTGAHNCTDVIVSCAMEDYQVFRCYDVEFEMADLHDKAMEVLDTLPENERNNIEHDIDGWLEQDMKT